MADAGPGVETLFSLTDDTREMVDEVRELLSSAKKKVQSSAVVAPTSTPPQTAVRKDATAVCGCKGLPPGSLAHAAWSLCLNLLPSGKWQKSGRGNQGKL